MIALHGLPLSNFYNKVKLVLLEKGIPFEEVPTGLKNVDAAMLTASPMGKIPFLQTEHGPLCESQVIVDYLEAAYPQMPLMPSEPYAAAKVRELIAIIDMHMELTVRALYPQAFFGGTVSEGTQERVRKNLPKAIAAFKQIAKFSPYVAGEQFTLADCAAWVSLPLVAMASKAVLGEDLLAAGGVDWKPYVKLIGERESAQKVAGDRKAGQEGAKRG